MYKTQTNVVAIRTQKAISAALLSLIRERPYEEVTITEICRRADVVRRSFYNNFQTKDDVVHYLINDIFREMESRIDLKSMDVKQILLICFEFVLNSRDDLLLFYNRKLLRFAHKSITTYITANHIQPDPDINDALNRFVDQDNVSGIHEKTLDTRAYKYIAAQISAVLISVIETWIENGLEEPIEYMAELTEALMYKGNGTEFRYVSL